MFVGGKSKDIMKNLVRDDPLRDEVDVGKPLFAAWTT